ncbi:MAG: Asp-tRNA(Asn)/Glu-tRNA(Gln) amidotransferase subunit GatB [Bacilli bacterium]|nr:Asp-tRNA(Asn)/Glu-tRNA(Gln) amidotransferase subunit GatB [Bacilli bacterium]
MSKYKAVIGLEMHCELKSNSKVFSSAENSYSEIANSNIRPVDMAFPGTLPVANKKSIRDAIKMAMVLNCEVPEYMYFDRKNYYYPDLPKGYQITQFDSPVGVNGHIEIECNGEFIPIDIHDIHLEEDAASMDHLYDTSVIDYNRAGVPLLELVTEPCIHSAEEAVAFLEHMRSAYKYCDVSEADTKKGQIRCDVNVSIMEEDATEFGTRVEIKNINSFGNVYDAINYEIKRQSELKDAGRYDEVEQETRRFDEESGTTIRMRSKADAIDYKYFVDPNLPKYKITNEWLEEIREEIPKLRNERKQEYMSNYSLSDYDATILVKEKEISDYFEKCIEIGMDPKEACNWVNVNIIAYINKYELEIKDIYLTPEMLKFIVDNIKNGTISSKQAKEVFFKVLDEKKEPSNFISKENAQISDVNELEKIIDEIIGYSSSQVEQYRSGKDRLFDYFVGQVMKNTRGKANPIITKELLHKKLDI